MAHEFDDFCTDHIYKWLTGDEILCERFLAICNDQKLPIATRMRLLKDFASTVRDTLIDNVKWDDLIRQGQNHGK